MRLGQAQAQVGGPARLDKLPTGYYFGMSATTGDLSGEVRSGSSSSGTWGGVMSSWKTFLG